MTVPVIQSLMQQHPQLKVTVLSVGFLKPLFAGIPGVSFYTADPKHRHKGIKGLLRLFRELKTLRVDAVADLHDVLRSKVLRTLFKASGTPVVSIDKGRAEKKALTRAQNKVFRPLKTTHQRYADVFARLGFPIDLLQHQFPAAQPLSPTAAALTGPKQETWIGIAPFSQYASKVYPLDLMEQVVAKLAAQPQTRVLLFGGGPKEVELLDGIAQRHAGALNLAGKIKLPDELSVISHLDLMISMDSGNAHFAAMLGRPVLTMWGVTHPYAGFYPFGQDPQNALLADRTQFPAIPTSIYGNKFPPGYEECMRTISPDTVVAKVQEILQRTS